MDTPLISIIIPSYNRGHILMKSVNSVLSQTYEHIELIIVDDASTDNTAEIIHSLTDSRIKFIHLEHNSGACAARNEGIQEAEGKYIAFNDSDDQWHSNKLSEQLSFIRKNNADVVVCSMNCYDENKNRFLHTFPHSMPEGRLSYKDLLFYNCSSTQLLFGKALCFKTIQFDSKMPRMQDWDEILRLSQHYTICRQNDILVDTYIQKDSITRHPEKAVLAMNLLLEKHYNAIIADKAVTEAFFSKKLVFELENHNNPVKELQVLYQCHPSFRAKLKLILAQLGLYRILVKS
jgi:glycosyltransferase involved in cell wall biosynthesis